MAYRILLSLVVLLSAAACGDDETSSSSTSASTSTTTTSGAGGSGGLPGCADLCVDVVAEQCTNGPPDQAACTSGCEMVRNGPCAPEYQVLAACAGPNPDYACDAGGSVVVTGCEAENTALSNCLAAGGG